MLGEPTNEAPGSFFSADRSVAAGQLAAILREEDAEALVVYDERGIYGHPDHMTISERVGAAVAAAAYRARTSSRSWSACRGSSWKCGRRNHPRRSRRSHRPRRAPGRAPRRPPGARRPTVRRRLAASVKFSHVPDPHSHEFRDAPRRSARELPRTQRFAKSCQAAAPVFGSRNTDCLNPLRRRGLSPTVVRGNEWMTS